jgi:AcrR family transcriptional regulator
MIRESNSKRSIVGADLALYVTTLTDHTLRIEMAKEKKEQSNIARRRQLAQDNGDREYQQKREQLFQIAGKVFREKGYDGASINDFATAIGIDRASVYYYISGKEELFQEIVQKAVRANVTMIEAIRASAEQPENKIEAFIVGLMKSYEEHYPYLYVYVQEDMARISAKNSSWAREMKKLGDRFEVAALEIVKEGIEKGVIQTWGGSAQLTAFAIVGMCNWSHRWFRPTGKVSAETIGRQFAGIVLNGIIADKV